MPVRSLTADRIRCLQPRERSVVCTAYRMKRASPSGQTDLVLFAALLLSSHLAEPSSSGTSASSLPTPGSVAESFVVSVFARRKVNERRRGCRVTHPREGGVPAGLLPHAPWVVWDRVELLGVPRRCSPRTTGHPVYSWQEQSPDRVCLRRAGRGCRPAGEVRAAGSGGTPARATNRSIG